MHRKIAVIDGEVAFVGGINYSADHLGDYGPEAKQDWSVEIRGPLVAEIHRFCHTALAEGQRHQREQRQWWRGRRRWRMAPEALPAAGDADAMFVVRDNRRTWTTSSATTAWASARRKKRIVIANAYFFPGYRLHPRPAARGAARRRRAPDPARRARHAMGAHGATMLYHHLLKAGVRIYEYCDRPLHGKVALMDDDWATIGSSNLDPLSLALNLEANVIIRNRAFNAAAVGASRKLMCESCSQIEMPQELGTQGLGLGAQLPRLPLRAPLPALGLLAAAACAAPDAGRAARRQWTSHEAIDGASLVAVDEAHRRLRVHSPSCSRCWCAMRARSTGTRSGKASRSCRAGAAGGTGLAAISHLIYSLLDLVGRHYTGHTPVKRKVMQVSFTSYAFNLNLGSLVGGIGFRYRLYSKLGLRPGQITRIVTMSMITNWIGYILLAGVVFSFFPLQLPPNWHMGNHGLQYIGAVLVAISAAYLIACWRMGDHVWTVRGHELYLPPPRMAMLQMAISCINWCLMAAIIWVLLQQKIAYTDVLTVLLVGAIAGVVLHVPAGLGVTVRSSSEPERKLAILADAAKYDASCASSGGVKRDSSDGRGIGSVEGAGICHSYAPDGRCISLLKILLTNFCQYDCLYCVNRVSSNVPRARFTIDEVVQLTLDFYRRNCIEGLFLSSGIIRSPDYTMEQVVEVARRCARSTTSAATSTSRPFPTPRRNCWQRAGRYADRLSINIELPTEQGLAALAPEKDGRRSSARWRACACTSTTRRARRDASRQAPSVSCRARKPARARKPQAFAAAGQSTQMIVGADATDDATILATSASCMAPTTQARLLLRLQPDPARRLRAAAAGAAAGARTPAVPGRLADALLRLRRRRDRAAHGGRHAAAGGRSQAGLGAGAPEKALPGRPGPRAARTAAARAGPGREGGRPPAAGAPRAPAARRRPEAPARAHAQGAALRRAGRPPPARAAAAWCAAAHPGAATSAPVLTPCWCPPMFARLSSETDLAGFRREARALLARQVPPDEVQWSAEPMPGRPVRGPKATRADDAAARPPASRCRRRSCELCDTVVLHSDPQRFALLYRLLWRLVHEPALRNDPLDPDMLQAQQMAQAVRRDIHKMHAFVRFRQVPDGEHPLDPLHVAWFEPDHHIVEAVRRGSPPLHQHALGHPDARALRRMGPASSCTSAPARSREDAPPPDAGEQLWLTYYQSIFNPARLKLSMMRKEMPRKYWRNLPEAQLIAPLAARGAGTQRRHDRATGDGAARRIPRFDGRARAPARRPAFAGGPERRATRQCRECPIGALATQAVPAKAAAARADVRRRAARRPGGPAGRPFVGPAGQLLDRALRGWASRARRCTSPTPCALQVRAARQAPHPQDAPRSRRPMACRHWLDEEIALVQPQRAGGPGRHGGAALLGRRCR
jgi:hypothetical protein